MLPAVSNAIVTAGRNLPNKEQLSEETSANLE
jgi:hypothetical protein